MSKFMVLKVKNRAYKVEAVDIKKIYFIKKRKTPQLPQYQEITEHARILEAQIY